MSNVTYSQVLDLVKRVPPTRLKRAYNMILNLTETDISINKDISQVEFMKLPVSERRKIMKDQAKKMIAHYKETTIERENWQGGDFFDENQAQ